MAQSNFPVQQDAAQESMHVTQPMAVAAETSFSTEDQPTEILTRKAKTMTRFFLKALLAGALISMCAAFSSCSTDKTTTAPTEKTTIAESSGYTDPMQIPLKDLTCHSGGPSSTECKIEPGVKIGDLVSIGCGITCYEGYYACCGVRCACIPEK